MKLLFVNNTQNNFFILAKYLRQSGIDASLLIPSNADVSEIHLPQWHDLSVDRASADSQWILFEEVPIQFNPFRFIGSQMRLNKFLRNFDVIVASGLGPIWVRWVKSPFIFLALGRDLDQLAIQGWAGDSMKHAPSNWKERTKSFIIRTALRDSLKKAAAVVVAPYQVETAKRLGLRNLRFLPHVMDTDLLKPMEDSEKRSVRARWRKRLDCDFIFFHPSRQVWVNRDVPICKGNDKVFRAFGKFIKETGKKAKLIVIETGWDVPDSKKLISECGIAEHVIWKQPMKRPDLREYYNVADIVFDQFTVGVFALVAVEAMACGTPVFSYVNPGPDGLFYPEMPPLINVRSIEEIFTQLCNLTEDEDYRTNLGKRSRDWIMKYAHWEVAIQEHIDLYQEVLS
jgi:glycosyltransferase involved in cell wall biosynthesis